MLRESDYWMGRDEKYPEELTGEIEANAAELLGRVNNLLAALGWADPDVRSGWRPHAINDATSNAAAHSKHLTGQAIDLADPDRSLARAIKLEPDVLVQFGLFAEDFRWTPSWVHLQSVPPKSGRRIYVPNNAPALAPPVLA